jgi:hypothetical protein
MIITTTIAIYSVLTILTNIGNKSFENMGRFIKKSGDTIRRILRPGEDSLKLSQAIAQKMFAGKKVLYVPIDETKVNKVFSKMMEGASWLFDTKIGRRINAYKLIVGAVSDGKFTVPLNAALTFGKDFYPDPKKALLITVQLFVKTAQALFPGVKIIATLDGAFATIEVLSWALENKIAMELRMHSNRVVEHKGKRVKIRDIKGLHPKGRQMARTIQVTWNGLYLHLTAVRRFDKHNNETIVYQVATYQAKPSQHALAYKNRWGIEKLFRTTKQTLGLQECFSTKIVTQYNHMCAVLLAYAIAQQEMKKMKYKNPEEAIRAFKKKNHALLNQHMIALDQINSCTYA